MVPYCCCCCGCVSRVAAGETRLLANKLVRSLYRGGGFRVDGIGTGEGLVVVVAVRPADEVPRMGRRGFTRGVVGERLTVTAEEEEGDPEEGRRYMEEI